MNDIEYKNAMLYTARVYKQGSRELDRLQIYEAGKEYLWKSKYKKKKPMTYDFTCDWWTDRVNQYKSQLEHLKNADFSYLEIGTYEGRSALWFADNFPKCNVTCIDPYQPYHDLPIHLIEEAEKRFYKNKEGKNITHYKQGFIDFALSTNNKKYDVIYVDGSHLSFDAFADATIAWRLLNNNGIMILDDYELQNYDKEYENCKTGIDYFLKNIYNQHQVLYRGWQIVIKKTPAYDEMGFPNKKLGAKDF